MDKFDLKKFLTENKLTKTSVLREGFEETNSEPYDETYTDRNEWIETIKTKYPNAKPNAKFGDNSIWFDNGNRVAQWVTSEDAGKIYFNVKPLATSPFVSDDPSNPPTQRSAYGFKNEEKLKTKIKEMIIAELTEENDVVAGDYNFVAEGEDFEDAGVETGEVGEKDYEDYQELKKFLNTLKDTKASDDIFNYGSEIDPNEGYDEFDAQYDEKFKLSEFFIDEAKKDEEAPEEELSDEEIDTTIDTTDTGEDFKLVVVH